MILLIQQNILKKGVALDVIQYIHTTEGVEFAMFADWSGTDITAAVALLWAGSSIDNIIKVHDALLDEETLVNWSKR